MTSRVIDRRLLDAIEEVAAPTTTLAEILAVAERLQGAGIEASALDAIKQAGLTISLGQEQPELPGALSWYVAVQRWPTGCRCCGAEVKRGELTSIGKLRDGSWAVECSSCRELDPQSERADDARKRAVTKELDAGGDPEELIERMREHAPRELHEAVEDLLLAVVATREGE